MEIRDHVAEQAEETQSQEGYQGAPRRTLFSALLSITIADVSMSLDNVIAVAAIARENTVLLVFGLVLAIVLMGFGATMIVKLLTRYPSISYLGLIILLYTALQMMWDGWPEIAAMLF